jgi:predicted nuclease with TOPRIM domain
MKSSFSDIIKTVDKEKRDSLQKEASLELHISDNKKKINKLIESNKSLKKDNKELLSEYNNLKNNFDNLIKYLSVEDEKIYSQVFNNHFYKNDRNNSYQKENNIKNKKNKNNSDSLKDLLNNK